MAYLAANGLTPGKARVTTVDIGWRGSIQSYLALLFPEVSFQGLYMGLEKRPGNMMAQNTTKQAYVVDLERSPANSDFVTYVAPLEFLCSAGYGSTVGYSLETPPTPIRLPLDYESEAAFDNTVAPFQAGVIAAAKVWADAIRADELRSSDLLGPAVQVWADLIQNPKPQVATGFAETTLDETFGFGRTMRIPRDVRVSVGLRDMVRALPWPHAYKHYATSRSPLANLALAAVKTVRRSRRMAVTLSSILRKR